MGFITYPHPSLQRRLHHPPPDCPRLWLQFHMGILWIVSYLQVWKSVSFLFIIKASHVAQGCSNYLLIKQIVQNLGPKISLKCPRLWQYQHGITSCISSTSICMNHGQVARGCGNDQLRYSSMFHFFKLFAKAVTWAICPSPLIHSITPSENCWFGFWGVVSQVFVQFSLLGK